MGREIGGEWIQVNVWQNQYNIISKKKNNKTRCNKIKTKNQELVPSI